MLTEEFFTTVSGPPLTSNTAIGKDVAIYHQTLSPSYSVRTTFKKSSTPVGGLAVSDSHVFAAQQDKAYVHVYSRLRGGQEAVVPVPDRVRCVALTGSSGSVLVAGTVDGRLFLWETATGRLVATPPCHVQAVSCLAVSEDQQHVLSGSEDANVHVWSLPQLLRSDAAAETEPVRTLSRHRAAVTGLVVGAGGSDSRDTSLAVSASSRDKTVVLWNYRTGVALRTLLFPAATLCIALDPAVRVLYVAVDAADSEKSASSSSSSSSSSLYAVELASGQKPLLGNRSLDTAEAVSITTPLGLVPAETGPIASMTVSYDGTTLLSGHPRGQILQWNLSTAADAGNVVPVELASLNAAVTNVQFVAPRQLVPGRRNPKTTIQNVVKPSQASRDYTLHVRLENNVDNATDAADFDAMVHGIGFPELALQKAILAMQEQPETVPASAATPAPSSDADADLRRQNEELLEIVNEQRALYQQTLQRYADLKASTANP